MEQTLKPKILQEDFKFMFEEAIRTMLQVKDAEKINLTDLFWEVLEDKLRSGEQINISVRGEVRSGKSSVAVYLAYRINQMIEEMRQEPITHEMYRYIFSDQIEFTRFIDADIWHRAVVIDEFNRMSETGVNSTTEEALFDYYSDVFAGKKIHKITVSPKRIYDNNATIILDYKGKDPEMKVSRFLLKYRDIVSNRVALLGYVDFYMEPIISNWVDNVEKRFEKRPHSDEDMQFFEEESRKDFYTRYQIKKYKRMQLLEKEGIRDLREPEFAIIVLEALAELEDKASLRKVSSDIVDLVVEEIRRKHRRIYSMVAESKISSKVSGLLSLYTEINKLKAMKNSPRKKIGPEEMELINKSIDDYQQMLDRRVLEQRKLDRLFVEYTEIK